MDVVEVDGLTKVYGARRVVDQVGFTVRGGSVTGFLGPNGAGKTTTLRMLLGLAAPTHGRAMVFGRPYRGLPDPARRVGTVLDMKAFHPARTGRDHLRVLATAAGMPLGRADELLETVGLAEHGRRRVKTYSLGMKQRLGLATALLCDPDLLVLDEPANGLDPEGIRWLRRFLRDRASSGRTVLLSSHLLAEMAQTVEHVVIVDRGRVVADSPVHTLLSGGGVRVRSPQVERLGRLLAVSGEVRVLAGDEIEVRGLPLEAVAQAAAAAGVPIHGITSGERTLEDAFFALTGSAVAA